MPTNISRLSFSRFVARDPRYYQIAVLASLLIYGVGWLNFDTGGREIAILLCSVLITQFLCGKYLAAATFDPRSALISGISLCLLLRTNSVPLLIVTAAVTIASKFVLKWNHKHIFNPTNFGTVAMIALSGEVWVSPQERRRYVLRHPWKGEEASCPATDDYRREVLRRQENEARQLAELTGWDLAGIRAQMNLRTATTNGGEKWWQKLWPR